MRGMLIIGSGPSGAGKNSVFNEVLRLQKGKIIESVSCTTRPPRPGEVEGVDYYFVSLEQFEQWERDGHFLEAVGAHNGKRYGTPLQPVLDKLEAGIDVLLVIEVNGAKIARERMPQALAIFIMPGGDTLEARSRQLEAQLRKRGTDSDEMIAERLEIAIHEMDQASDYHHVVVNAPGELDKAVRDVMALIDEARTQHTAGN